MVPDVRSLLLQRRDRSSRRGFRHDPYHVALVIEGGGMGGVVAGGMVTAIQQLGLTDCFDTVHGSSAGACAGAYLLSGQSELGTSIYYEDINNTRVVNPLRIFLGRPVMDAGYVTDVIRNKKALNLAPIFAEPGVLHIIATTVHGEERVYSNFRSPDHFFAVLHGTITMPILSGISVEVEGEHIVDGGMVQQIPIRSALRAGATHVLTILTRRHGEFERKPSVLALAAELIALRCVYGNGLAKLYERRWDAINSFVELSMARSVAEGVPSDCLVRPSESIQLQRFSVDASHLLEAKREAIEVVTTFFA